MKTKLKNKLSPTQIIAMGFLITIFIGSILLKLPIAYNSELSYLDSLFTATSATCVTGLYTIDVASTFTLFGQIILMFLVQIGGLGFMLIIALILMWMGRKITLKNRILISQSVSKTDFEGVVKLLRKILKYTLTFELFGALILATRFVPESGWGLGLFKSLFYSISSFCNAGFDVFSSESLIPYTLDRTINITIMFLIQIGGLGFLVWEDISNCIGTAIRERTSFARAVKKFSLHTKIVLICQIIFVLLGMFAFMAFEYDNVNTIGKLELNDKLLVSAFQSISARSAGMYTVSMNALNDTTKLLMIFLMLVGGAPGSMTGGIKTVTLVVILFGMIAMAKGKRNITIFKRTIPRETYEKATAVFVFMITISFISVLIIMCNLLVVLPAIDVTFDTVGTITTVGLSTGVINHMNSISRFVILILMFVGRVGTVTPAVVFMIGRQRENDDIVYATEDVIVG